VAAVKGPASAVSNSSPDLDNESVARRSIRGGAQRRLQVILVVPDGYDGTGEGRTS